MANDDTSGETVAREREHELQTFLRQDVAEIASEYDRIYARAVEDPGTAGDEGEENWAALLREWLPDSYKVVTKGRILGVDGSASPQVDVIVLSGAYPARLLTKKVYLVHGVAAVFECKTTLRASHLTDAAGTAASIRGLAGARSGSPYRELFSPPLFGVLAHSHSWKAEGSTPRENIDKALKAAHVAAAHPRDLLDLVCVADLGSWHLGKMPYLGRVMFGDKWTDYRANYGLPEEGGTMSFYSRWHADSGQPEPNPVAVFVALLLQHLAWEDSSLRPLADYFRLAGLWGSSQGSMRPWPVDDVFSSDTSRSLKAGALVNGAVWNEWSMHLP